MRVSGLEVRVTQRERCPYCHDAMGAVERVACDECGTPHHPACLQELGACTVLGCNGAISLPSPPAGSVDELRARVHTRASRFVSRRSNMPRESEEAVRRRLARQPAFCGECLKEIRVFSCPRCDGPLSDTCDGSARHCPNLACRPFYDRLCRRIGAPIDAETPWAERTHRVAGIDIPIVLIVASVLACGLLTVISVLLAILIL